MPFHSTLTLSDIHSPISFEYPDEALRLADTGLASSDLYKIARQTDDNTLWMLTATTPTWTQVGLGDGDVANTIYLGDGTIGANRTVSAFSSVSLDFNFYSDSDGSAYFNRAALHGDSSDASMAFYSGDGAGADLTEVSVDVSASGIILTNTHTSGGAMYAADYSAVGELSDRWIPDKAWVVGHVSDNGGIYGGSGTLSGNTVATGYSSDDLTFRHYNDTDGSGYTLRGEMSLTDAGHSMSIFLGDGAGADLAEKTINMTNTNILVTDEINTLGLVYAADYSGNGASNDRWIPDIGSILTWSGDRVFQAQDGGSIVIESTEDQGDAVGDDRVQLRLDDEGASHFWRIEENGVGQQTYAGFTISTAGVLTVIDTIGTKGLVYSADYSANGDLDDRWIPDKAWVEDHTGGGSIYTSNGTVTAARTLTNPSDQTMTLRSFDTAAFADRTNETELILDSADLALAYFEVDGSGTDTGFIDFRVASGGIVITDDMSHGGMKYAANYANDAGFSNRSIPDKAYVDGAGIGYGNITFNTFTQRDVLGYNGFELSLASLDNATLASSVDFTEVFQDSEAIYIAHSTLDGSTGAVVSTREVRATAAGIELTGTPALQSTSDDYRLPSTVADDYWLIGTNGSAALSLRYWDNSESELREQLSIGATGGNMIVSQNLIIGDAGNQIRLPAGLTTDDQWRFDAGAATVNDNLTINYYDDDGGGQTTYFTISPTLGTLNYQSDQSTNYTSRSVVDKAYVDDHEGTIPAYASQVSGAATNQALTGTETIITLDSTIIDGSGSEYSITLGSDQFDMDSADGTKVYKVSWTAQINLQDQAQTGAVRSYAQFRARLDGVYITQAEQWAYIREFQGGSNGTPNTGMAGTFLCQPAADDILDFSMTILTDTGEAETVCELASFFVVLERVA